MKRPKMPLCFAAICLLVCTITPAQTANSRPGEPGVALVLSGGGARGGAHVGVLKVLEQNQVPIDLIVGTSFGALVGALYSIGYSAQDIELILQQVDWDYLLDDVPDRRLLNLANKARADRRLFRLELEDSELRLPTGLQSGQKIRQLLDRLTAIPVMDADNRFDHLEIPYRAVATDILTGKPYVFDRGSLSRAVRASIAVPGLFTPVEVGEMLLLDGGLANNLPVDVARSMGAKVVIAVDVSTPLRSDKSEIRSLLDILDQAISIHIEEHKQRNIEQADIVISPNLEDFASADFSEIDAMIPQGESAASASYDQIEAALSRANLPVRTAQRRDSVLSPESFTLSRFQVSNRILRPDSIQIEGLESDSGLARDVRRDSVAVTLNRIDRRVSRLYSTDRFREVNYLLEKDQLNTVLTYQVDQAAKTQLGLGVRYDRDFNFTGAADLTSRELRGSRNDFHFQALVGNAKLARIELSNRSLTPSFQVAPSVYARSFERKLFRGNTSLGEFDDRRAGFRLAASQAIGNAARVELAYHFDRVNLDGVQGNLRQPQPDSLAGVEAVFDLDTLDNADFPSAGWQAHVSADIQAEALGGDFDFRRFRVEGKRYVALQGRSVVGLSARWGLTQGDVPFYEEFFTGGSHYFSFSAAPFAGLDRGQRRSRQLLTAGLDFRRNWKQFPLGFLQRIDWSVKYNAGIFSQELSLLQFQELLHGVTAGIHFGTRFLGPISLELGGTSEGDFNTYISIGHFF